MATLTERRILSKYRGAAVLYRGDHARTAEAVAAAVAMGAELVGAFLRCEDLGGLAGRGADLRHADLCWSDLRGADLRFADLRNADLRFADLTGADLEGAMTAGARLDGAVVDGVRLDW